MLKIKTCCSLVFFLTVILLPLSPLRAQALTLFHEGFEKKNDSSWFFKNAQATEKQSFKGQRCIAITGPGEASYALNIPAGVEEVLLRGWLKLSGGLLKANYDQGAFITIETSNEASPKKSLIRNEDLLLLSRNTGWTNFELEVTIPAGTSRIYITCKNSFENSTAYFDEIEIEKRQLGFVKKEMPWSKEVKRLEEKTSLLVKNGNFEDGAQVWNPHWGFELSGVAYSGEYSCMIQNKDSGVYRGTSADKLFNIPAGTQKLKVSAWIKAENVVGGPNAWETGALLVSLTDNFGNEVPGGGEVARTVGTHDWRKFEAYFTISERATKFNILLQLAASTGKIYFDEIFAEPMSDEEYYLANSVLRNPGFESLLSGWPTYAGEASTEQAHSGKYSLKVGGETAAWAMRIQEVMLVRGKNEFTFSIWMKTVDVTETPNVWEGARVIIEFKDINGISLGDAAIGRAVGNTDWQQYTKTVKVPQDAVSFTISCGRANVAGNAYFDDAQLIY